MATVIVYNFRLYNEQHGTFLDAKGKCTRELIESLNGQVLEDTAEEIDENLLSETGRYHVELD